MWPKTPQWFDFFYKLKSSLTLCKITKYLGVHYDWKRDEKGKRYVIDRIQRNTEKISTHYEEVTGTKAKIAEAQDFRILFLKRMEMRLLCWMSIVHWEEIYFLMW